MTSPTLDPRPTPPGLSLPTSLPAPPWAWSHPGCKGDKERHRRGSYTDVLCQGDYPLVTFDPRGGLQQWAGGGLALGHRPQVWEVCGLPAELPGACGQNRAGQGVGGRRGVCLGGCCPQVPAVARGRSLHVWAPHSSHLCDGAATDAVLQGVVSGSVGAMEEGGALPGCLCRRSPSRWLLSSSSRCLGSPLSWVRLGELTGLTGSTPSGL